MDWLAFFTTGWGIPFSLYVIVQILALIVLRNGQRLRAAITIIPMTYVAKITAEGWLNQSNLWPIWMILISPLALIFVFVPTFDALTNPKPPDSE